MAGRKPESFTDKENAALRAALKRLMEDRGWSQKETADKLGRGQQSVGTLKNGGGFSLPTARSLAALLDTSVDAILRAAGAIPNPMTVPQGWQNRETAVAIARTLGYDEEVIRRVVVKYQESQYSSLPARWWNDRIVNETAEQQAVAAMKLDSPANNTTAAAPVPEKPAAVEKPAKPKRHRKTG